jgi:hypothetical protein
MCFVRKFTSTSSPWAMWEDVGLRPMEAGWPSKGRIPFCVWIFDRLEGSSKHARHADGFNWGLCWVFTFSVLLIQVHRPWAIFMQFYCFEVGWANLNTQTELTEHVIQEMIWLSGESRNSESGSYLGKRVMGPGWKKGERPAPETEKEEKNHTRYP